MLLPLIRFAGEPLSHCSVDREVEAGTADICAVEVVGEFCVRRDSETEGSGSEVWVVVQKSMVVRVERHSTADVQGLEAEDLSGRVSAFVRL